MPAWTYILLCSDDSYYTGCTTNIEQRLSEHHEGKYDGYTKQRKPVKLVWMEEFDDVRLAIDIEQQIKRWTKRKKEALIKGDFKLLHEYAKSSEKREREKFLRKRREEI